MSHERRREVAHRDLGCDEGQRSLGLHRRAHECSGMAQQATAGVNVRQLAVATVIGNVVGNVSDQILFGG